MENIGVFGNSFVGTVIIVGQDILHRGFKLGDTVAGYIEAGLWVDILDGRSQEYLQIQPDKVWHICSTEMKRMGFVDSAMGDGCTII
ncbi:hypothetical protein FRB94_007175 [Tulasnella sp. JGI-2019a]|nr:hypothetical protein FRB93_009661 [Tulasnella sp. JGI-2019a]KAG8998204.1 hypothetical protein FRB94_007175 [Tulasnella sp. JGI-2019a]